jgi:hypothetical protein
MDVSSQLHAPAALFPYKLSPNTDSIGRWVSSGVGLESVANPSSPSSSPSQYRRSYPNSLLLNIGSDSSCMTSVTHPLESVKEERLMIRFLWSEFVKFMKQWQASKATTVWDWDWRMGGKAQQRNVIGAHYGRLSGITYVEVKDKHE